MVCRRRRRRTAVSCSATAATSWCAAVAIGTGRALLESIHKCLYNELDGQFINSLHVLSVAIS